MHFETIICCNVPVDPQFKDKKLRWQLLIPILLLQTLTSEPPLVLSPVSSVRITKKKKVPNIININFTGKDDFTNFVNKAANY